MKIKNDGVHMQLLDQEFCYVYTLPIWPEYI